MFNLFKKKENSKEKNVSLIAVASLLIHSAKIDQNYSNNEKEIIKKALIEMGANKENINELIINAENKEKDSNQILDFTREIKNINEEDKKIIIEALWDIIYSDEDADMYESNLMRRLSKLLYVSDKEIGDLKMKINKNFVN